MKNEKEKEEFKIIKGWGGNYQISNYGRVKSSDRTVTKKNGVVQFFKGRILKPLLIGGNNDSKYDSYILNYKGSRKQVYSHRLVGEYFLDLPDNYIDLQINHIDFNKQNNHYSNLEWVTTKENSDHLWYNRGDEMREKISKSTIGVRKLKTISYQIIKKSFDGKIIKVYKDYKEVMEDLNIPISTLRSNIIRGINKNHIIHFDNNQWEYWDRNGLVFTSDKKKNMVSYLKENNIKYNSLRKSKLNKFFDDYFEYGEKTGKLFSV